MMKLEELQKREVVEGLTDQQLVMELGTILKTTAEVIQETPAGARPAMLTVAPAVFLLSTEMLVRFKKLTE